MFGNKKALLTMTQERREIPETERKEEGLPQGRQLILPLSYTSTFRVIQGEV